jgi:putative ABC transport system permease protein
MLKLMVRDVRKNLLQYLSMIIITMLAVTLFCGFVSNTLTLERRTDDYFAVSNLTDLTAQFSSIDADDRAYFAELSDSGGISAYEYRFYAEGSVGRRSGKIYAGNNAISAPVVVEGTSGVLLDISMKGAAEVAVGKIENDDYYIGKTIEVEIPGYPAMQFEVTGFMRFAEVSTYTYCPVFIDEDTLCAAIFEKTGLPVQPELIYNQVLIKTDQPETVKAQTDAHYAEMPSGGLIYIFDRDAIESVVALNGEVTTSRQMIYVFPVIFLLVSILVIMTTVSALILRERTNIGTLKAIGKSNRAITLHYACFGAVLCLIGGIIGAVIAPLIVPNVLLIKYNLVYSMPASDGIVFSALWSAVAVLSMCALALLIGVTVCRRVVKKKPAECMRPAPPRDSVLLKLTNVKADGDKSEKGNLPLRMAVRNIIVNPSRAVMTIVGVMGCSALLVCSFGIGDTVNHSVDMELGGQFKYDISTIYTRESADEFLSLVNELKESGQIRAYETYETYFMTARSENAVKSVKVFSIAEDSAFTAIRPHGGALISKAVADEMNVRRGDVLDLTAGTNAYRVEITGIVETAVTKGIFVTSDMFDGNYCAYGMWIAADDTPELMELIKSGNGTQSAVSMRERVETVTEAVSSINMIKLTMMIFSIALSVVVLYNLSLLNVRERNRSIATLKVLGFSNAEVSLTLFYEIMLLVIIGTAFGLLLGFPILYLVLSINKIEIIAFLYHIKPASYALSALVSLLTAAAINLIFGAVIKRIKMMDSLKSVE